MADTKDDGTASAALPYFASWSAALPLAAATPSFNRDIAPIIDKHCASCHHVGGIGPFSLVSYHDARSHASQIAAVTKQRYMPPGRLRRDTAIFADERRLSDEEIRLLAAWANAGAPEGPPKQSS